MNYAALRIGKVGIVAPIVSTEGAIAAVISVAAGERLQGVSYALLAIVAVGVVLAGAGHEGGGGESGLRPVLLAVGGASLFGVSLYATGRVGAELPLFWAVLPARLVGVVAVAVPLIATSRLRLTRSALSSFSDAARMLVMRWLPKQSMKYRTNGRVTHFSAHGVHHSWSWRWSIGAKSPPHSSHVRVVGSFLVVAAP